MKKVSRQLTNMEAVSDKPEMTVGLDLGDRYSHYCLLNADGQVIEEGRMQSTEAAVAAIASGTVVTLAWDTEAVKAFFPPILAARDAIFPALAAAVIAMVVVSLFTPKPAPEQLAKFES
jgi:Na+/proline symporter